MTYLMVTGSRTWDDRDAMERTLIYYLERYPKAVLLTGGAQGADRMAERIAREAGAEVLTVDPDWKRYGRRAGFVRNLDMLKKAPVLVVAFWDGRSKGTAHAIANAVRLGISVAITPMKGRA